MRTAKAQIQRESIRDDRVGKAITRPHRRKPRRKYGDWAEKTPSREHVPLGQRMADSIEVSSRLSKLPVIGREQPEDVIRMIPEEVVPILKGAEIEFVLAGAHGIGGWLAESRATEDVDFIIRVRDAKRAAEAVLRKFTSLELEKYPDVWRFKQGDKYLLDLILTRAPLFKRVFKDFHETGIQRHKVKVPKLEAALAMKFASMVGHWRNLRKKKQDAVDFMSMVEANSNIDLDFLQELGELVYSGGGKEVVKYVEDLRAGRDLEI